MGKSTHIKVRVNDYEHPLRPEKSTIKYKIWPKFTMQKKSGNLTENLAITNLPCSCLPYNLFNYFFNLSQQKV